MSSNPSPNNGTTGVSRTKDLSWVGSDPDNDNLTYYIYFGTNSTPNSNDLVSSNQNETTYDLGVLGYYTRYYWKIVTKDEHGVNTSGPIWNFRTVRKSSGGGGSLPDENQKPVADANGPYNGVIGEAITFDGSSSYDSDAGDSITSYSWTFGDGAEGNGKKPTHIYTTGGTYSISLTVKDSYDESDIDYTSVVISADSDDDGWNDDIEEAYGTNPDDKDDYPLDTDEDGIPDEPSDDGSYSGDTDDDNDGLPDDIEELIGTDSKITTTYEDVDIDNIITYLIDTDDDGDYDVFYNPETKTKTIIEFDDGDILIDLNDDGISDYKYNIDTGELTLQNDKDEDETPAIGIFFIIISMAFIALFYRKKVI